MSIRRTGQLFPKEEAFCQHYAAGKGKCEAAEAAGYADPKGESDRLLARSIVLERVMELQRLDLGPDAVSWRRLLTKAKRALDENLDSANESAVELLHKLAETGVLDPKGLARFLKRLEITPSDRNTAARVALDMIARTAPKSLVDAAEREDSAGRHELVDKVLGTSAGNGQASEADEVTH